MTKRVQLINELEKLLNENIEKLVIPHVRGNSIRIKDHVIRLSKAGWLVYNIKENQQIARFFCKTAAVALAKTLAHGLDHRKEIEALDITIQKHYNDALFARHILARTQDEIKRTVSEMKYELAKERTEEARDKLDDFIFGKDINTHNQCHRKRYHETK